MSPVQAGRNVMSERTGHFCGGRYQDSEQAFRWLLTVCALPLATGPGASASELRLLPSDSALTGADQGCSIYPLLRAIPRLHMGMTSQALIGTKTNGNGPASDCCQMSQSSTKKRRLTRLPSISRLWLKATPVSRVRRRVSFHGRGRHRDRSCCGTCTRNPQRRLRRAGTAH